MKVFYWLGATFNREKTVRQIPYREVRVTWNQSPSKYYLSHAQPLQRQSRCTKTVLLFSRFSAKRRVRSKMTGMGNILATVALAVPLIAWLRGTFLFGAPQYLVGARALRAPREHHHSLEIQFSCYPDSPGATEVRL